MLPSSLLTSHLIQEDEECNASCSEVQPMAPDDGQPAAQAGAKRQFEAVTLGRTRGYGQLQEERDDAAAGPAGTAVASTAPATLVAHDEVPSEGARWKNAHAYIAFLVFGMGSGWIVVNSTYLELPVYQEHFGLIASNRMTLGYNFGTVVFPFYIAYQHLLRHSKLDMNYQRWILALAVMNVLALVYAAYGINSMEALVFLNFIGGGYGYLVGFVHQHYILTRYQSMYVAVFWAGDAAAGVLAATLAVVQQPEHGEDGRNFGPRTFYLGLVPMVPIGMLAFRHIESLGLGSLSEAPAGAAHPASGEIELATASGACDQGEPTAPLDTRLSGRCGRRALSFLPAGLRAQPRATVLLMFILFWTNFTNWGFGDSIYPYACARSSLPDAGESCAFYSSFGSVFAKLMGTNGAAFVKQPSLALLYIICAAYTCVFSLLFLAADLGGPWAHPLRSGPNVATEVGGTYVVALVLVMRTLGMFLATLALRLIQIEYDPAEWTSMNVLANGTAIVASLIAVLLATTFVQTLNV